MHDGHGFAMIRGLDPEPYSQEENIIIYLGISSYAGGEQRGRQTVKGAKLSLLFIFTQQEVTD